jgi:hypothetical protein
MNTRFQALLAIPRLRRPCLALAAALLASACGSSSSTNLMAPTAQKCQISVNGFTGTFGSAGGSGSAAIDAARECSWSAASQAPWISLTPPAEGSGAGTLSFTVSSNSAPRPRTGALTVNGQPLAVSQEAAPCRFGVSPPGVRVPAGGGPALVTVSASDAACAWMASSQSAWIAITGGGGGSGNGAAAFAALPNAGAERSGAVLVAGQVVSVTQDAAAPAAGPLPPSPSPTPPSPTPTPAPVPVQLAGEVSARKGDCPVLTFSVQGVAVVTTADTVFANEPCNKLKNGVRVTVEGTQQSGQPVVATLVRVFD